MSVNPLTLVVKIKFGEEEELRRILREIDAKPTTNPYIRLNEGGSTHLANWVMLNDPDNGHRLFFASNHDGDLASYVAELLRVGPGIDQIFRHCEGYTETENGEFLRFVKKNSYKSQTYFTGFREETLGSVLAKIAIRKQIESFMDMPDVAAFLNGGGLDSFLAKLKEVAQPERSGGLRRFCLRLRKKLHDWFFSNLLWFARWYGKLRVNDHCASIASNLDQPDIQANLSDANHMTNLIEVRSGFRLLLWVSLTFMQFLAKYAFPPGELAGVTTIHFARWVLIDRGKRLLFQSRFDGNWENYMGDFVDKIAWGLDTIWSNTSNYPTAGMNDIDAFKRFIRDRQFEHLAIYEAYPDESILNQMRDREITAKLGARFDEQAIREWLRLL